MQAKFTMHIFGTCWIQSKAVSRCAEHERMHTQASDRSAIHRCPGPPEPCGCTGARLTALTTGLMAAPMRSARARKGRPSKGSDAASVADTSGLAASYLHRGGRWALRPGVPRRSERTFLLRKAQSEGSHHLAEASLANTAFSAWKRNKAFTVVEPLDAGCAGITCRALKKRQQT